MLDLTMVASGVMGSELKSVLVIDDDASILAAARRSLARQWQVTTAQTAEQALALAPEAKPDVAIIDLRIAGASGLELLRQLKADWPEMVCVLYSGFLSISHAVQATREGADLVVSKPMPFTEILRRVTEGEPEPSEDEETPTLARVEWDHIARVLEDCGGNISQAARRLGIYRSSLQRRLRKHAPPR